MPSWYDRRKYSKGLRDVAETHRSEQFREDRFRRQYFLSKFELRARGYERIILKQGCGCVIHGSFDGFISVNHCTIKLTQPKPPGGQRPAPEFVVAVCMIPPHRRVSLDVKVEGKSKAASPLVEFWHSTDAVGSSNYSPDTLLMRVKHFASASKANIAEARMLLSDIAFTMPPANSEIKDHQGYFIDRRGSGQDFIECAALEITGSQDKDFCYPIMIKRDMEKILRLVEEEEDTSEKG
ncbi:hypothetical protein NX722_05295 [Endozoicomonas gorgoniicola]|uniref:Uncharacterized protein n=1 Tax=Endozoicomonas gorgoniicola TaxID=1234144 RepID=A0ABT3MRR2_9GAMM|nr:hypothetical protein [Endozoicomonas gorgoniicola]MCW7552067.1 hypothetical protein [Endozoicomonas gorgoniicola]